MGYPVLHFEVCWKHGQGEAAQAFYGDLFGWAINADNPMGYGIVDREGNTDENGVGIGGGVTGGPEGHPGHLTFYVEVPDVEEALAKAEGLGATRTMGPEDVMPGLTIGQFTDPNGQLVGVMTSTEAAG